jgi:excisionase family DNA binding protein
VKDIASLPDVLTVRQAAVWLGISYDAVLGYIHSGDLVGRTLPRRRTYLIDKSDLLDFWDAAKGGKVGHKVGHLPVAKSRKAQGSGGIEKRGANGEFPINPNWGRHLHVND